MQNIRLKSIWADRLALVLFAIILLGVALSWGLVVAAAGVNGANHVLASTGISWIEDGLIGIALLWVVLRTIDFARGGPTRALFSVPQKHEDKQPTASIGNDLAHHF